MMAAAICRPLTPSDRMQRRWIDGRPTSRVIAAFVRPNDRLSAFERLEIYNRMYWFRVLDSMHEDCPGLHALLGSRRFWRMARAYLARHPSRSYTLRNLCRRLPGFIAAEPSLTAPLTAAALDLARFEWAQVVAFDSAALPRFSPKRGRLMDPAQLRLRLQPHLTLLRLGHAVDDYLIAVKQQDGALRGAASQAVLPEPERRPGGAKAAPRLTPERVHLAVHRQKNQIYFKRLDLREFRLLRALGSGKSLADACALAMRGSKLAAEAQAAQVSAWFRTWTRLGWLCERA